MELTILITILVALITSIFGPMIVSWFKIKLEFSHKKSLIEKDIIFNKKIDSQLYNIMDRLGCDRIWLAQFHNGGNIYPTGKAIQKFSVFYEKIKPEIESVREVFQNIPLSLFPNVLCSLYREGEIHNNFNAEDSNLFKVENQVKFDSKSSYLFTIDDFDGNFMGMLNIDFIKEEYNLTPQELNYIRNRVGVIGSLLSKYSKVSLKDFKNTKFPQYV